MNTDGLNTRTRVNRYLKYTDSGGVVNINIFENKVESEDHHITPRPNIYFSSKSEDQVEKFGDRVHPDRKYPEINLD